MNIFVLDLDPIKAAKYYCNKHVVKMILESATMLAIPHKDPPCNKSKSWKNHPCTKWTIENVANYKWHCQLAMALCFEYTKRYGKIHKTQTAIEWYSTNIPSLPEAYNITTPYLAMPDDCKLDSVVGSYRKYYKTYKSGFAKWPEGCAPDWWNS